MEFLAHVADDRKQTVDAHLQGVAKLCSGFASDFDAASYGYLAGMAHDIGKFSEGFQKRLLENGPKVDHSTAGALECAKIGQEIVGQCVAGHHGGLSDFGNMTDFAGDSTFIGRIKKAQQTGIPDYSKWSGPLPVTPPVPRFFCEDFARSLWIRMLYSCLVDADFLDTESFMTNNSIDRGDNDDIETLWGRLLAYTAKWKDATSELNRIRNGIFADCIRAGDEDRGLFSLTVPTGGGKTVSSLAFALSHAKKHGLKRIIYVIPFTSIIEQNAAVFRDILGDGNVVEHHSEAASNYESDLTEEQKRAALAAENWDAPVIVTTAVQFFESLYANKPSKCRKLHNISNSVVIFDEAQSIPAGHLLPCMAAVGTLVRHFGVSAVLCSATQPYVSDLLAKYAPGMPTREICSNVDAVFDSLKRVSWRDLGQCDLPEIAQEMQQVGQALCIVNTRKTAADLFDLLPKDSSFHLSTLMMPQDRKETLDKIRVRLNNGFPCLVVSTSLIEAGVDIDFPLVYREKTGLDSIVQAAGRCNREGKRPVHSSIVTVFTLDNKIPSMFRLNLGATNEACAGSGVNGERQTVERYFRAYRSLIGNESIDKVSAVKRISEGISGCRLPFRTVAEDFHLIDRNTKTVYIPTEESGPLIEQIRNGTADRAVYRKAGRFGVSIYENHYRALIDSGDIEEIAPDSAVLVNDRLYSKHTGLSMTAENGKAVFI